ncbi:MAG TPA: hypothetical protein VGJ91_20180, partial [Polyangiaceae bacterium]
MGKSSGGLGLVLGLVSALVSACGSSSSGAPQSASGAAGSAAENAAGTSAHAGTGGAGESSYVGGTAGTASDGPAGASDAGTQNGAAGDSSTAGDFGSSGGAQNIFVAQIRFAQGGGPPLCLPRSLPSGLPGSESDGRVSCVLAELEPGSCDCTQTARVPLGSAMFSAAKKQLQASGACDGNSGVSCAAFCGCEIVQAPGLASDQSSQLYACQNELTVADGVNGFCLIDQSRTDADGAPAPLGNAALVAECPANEKMLLRVVGAATPASSA